MVHSPRLNTSDHGGLMRARNIKPDFFTDEKLISLTFAERLFFIGLWCFADSEGFFEVKPHEMKIKLFPEQKVDILKMLKALEKEKIVKLHEQHGYLPNFTKHQKPHPNEKKSPLKISIKEKLVKLHEDSCNYTSTQADIMNDECGMMNDDIMNDKYTHSGKNDKVRISLFEQLWQIYPIKKNKKKALEKFNKLKVTGELLKKMINSVNEQIEIKRKCDNNGKFCAEFPYLQKWLGEERWSDDIAVKTPEEIEHEKAKKKSEEEYGHLYKDRKI